MPTKSTSTRVPIALRLGLIGLLATSTSTSLAEVTSHREARLDYQVAAEATSCPAESAFRASVAARLGYDPFVAAAKRTAVVVLSGAPNDLRALVRMVGEGGASLGEKQLTSREPDCSELAAAAALALSIAIDPLTLTRPPPVDAGPPAALVDAKDEVRLERSEPARDAGVVVVVQAPPPGPNLELGAAATVSIGHQPTVAPGVLVEVRARWERFSLGLDARVELPSTFGFGRGSIRTVVFGAGLSPCAVIGSLEVCGVVVAGAMRSSGSGFTVSTEATTPELLAGVRAAFAVRLGSRWRLRVLGEGLARVVSVSLLVGNERAWTSPILAGLLGLAGIFEW